MEMVLKLSWSLLILFILAVVGCSHVLLRTKAPSPCSPTEKGCVCVDKVVPYPECSAYLSYPPDEIMLFLERYSK